MIENQTDSFSESMYYESVAVLRPMVHIILKFIYECTDMLYPSHLHVKTVTC